MKTSPYLNDITHKNHFAKDVLESHSMQTSGYRKAKTGIDFRFHDEDFARMIYNTNPDGKKEDKNI